MYQEMAKAEGLVQLYKWVSEQTLYDDSTTPYYLHNQLMIYSFQLIIESTRVGDNYADYKL